MNASLQLVRSLVKDFDTHKAAYLAPDYQEQQARMDFIDKFFMALGWDVNHERQKNPYEQEVKIENRVHFSGSQRRADYAFFVAPNFRDVKFFVEAKKPYHDLERADYYHQTIRYGWNSGTPVAILTDFEEFHIIDCRYKPDLKTALDRKLKVYSYTDYADEQKFAEIFYLFGREAVANGSLEKYASSLPKPRGKAVQKQLFKGGYQQVDQAFLELLDGYRSTLASAFKAKNPGLDSEQLTEAVQRTIDRLVFIRFLEDKQIEDPAIIDFRSKPSAWSAFIAHCRGMEPKYNGLIFKHHQVIDEPGFHPPDDDKFADICNELADPASPYDFDKIPISILGSIYERFLGKVVHATEKRARVEEKPEVRKAGGVYYTPQYIVRYIVQQTVGKLIEGKTPEEVARMAFADIACGSGSFLLEVYDTLLQYHTRWYNEHSEKAKKGTVETRDGKLALSLKTRQEILTNNIYGVDIDFQATEVTQLSLYLKLLEDVTLNDAHQFSLLKEKMLPDLRRNIVCGNSLIEPDIVQGDLFGKTDESHLKPMRFEDAFPHVMKRGGFDAVVGNPPYVRQESLSTLKSYYRKCFTVYHAAGDLYAYFVERGINLTRPDGLFSYIVANKWMRASYGEPLRKWLRELLIEEIIDFGDLQVFAGVSTYPCIIRVRKRDSMNLPVKALTVNSLEFDDLTALVKEQGIAIPPSSLHDSGWALIDETVSRILRQIADGRTTLGEATNNRLFFGIKTGINEAFVVDESTKSRLLKRDPKCAPLFKPFLAGRDIKRYGNPTANEFLICLPSGWTNQNSPRQTDKWGWFARSYPAIAEHLKQFEARARRRSDQGEYWWELRPCDYYDVFEKPKILLPDISQRGNFLHDQRGFYCANTCYVIDSSSKYFLGILNSSLFTFYYKSIASTYRGGYLRFFIQYLEGFPIRTINFSDPADKSRHDHIVKLVEQMLESKEKLAAAKTDAEVNRLELRCAGLDREIDNAVYELYGLTPEEIAIVEKG